MFNFACNKRVKSIFIFIIYLCFYVDIVALLVLSVMNLVELNGFNVLINNYRMYVDYVSTLTL